MRRGAATAVLVAALAGPAPAQEQTTVGMPARIEQIVLPGPELEVKPLDDRRRPIVLRIVKANPHGTAFRYDLVYYGLEAGDFDLRDYLRRKDGSAAANLPPLKVKIASTLGPGQVLPTDLESKPSPSLGGYRALLIGLGVVWVVVLAGILFARRRRRQVQSTGPRVLTLADRLRPLVERGVAGTLTPGEQADLERILLAYWRKRLKLEQARPAEAFLAMREHPEAGPLLERLEYWLHRPEQAESVDVALLLRPYQNVPADAEAPGVKV